MEPENKKEVNKMQKDPRTDEERNDGMESGDEQSYLPY